MIKAYIKSNMFHMPISHDELVKQVKEKINKPFQNGGIQKMFPLTKVEGNENIIVKKQKTNIFLLNFLMLILDKTNNSIDEEIYANDTTILEHIEKYADIKFESTTYENVEPLLINYLSSESKATEETIVEEEVQEDQAKKSEILSNVEYSLAWLKKADNEIN